MPRRPTFNLKDLTLQMQSLGPQTAAQLAAFARVGQPRISQVLANSGGSVVRIGAARRARYALRREIRMVGHSLPVFRINTAGRPEEYAQLEAYYQGWRVQWAGTAPEWANRVADPDGWGEGMPFFIGELRPQGFLGRLSAQQFAETLRLPVDVRVWSDDDALAFLCAHGEDLPGDLVVGETPLRRALGREVEMVNEDEQATTYPTIVTHLLAGCVPGSSVGGEQPKFLTTLRRNDGTLQPVMVKFTADMTTPVGRRWADLLVAEAHAQEILASAGEAEAGAHIVDAGGRRFLQMPRFDRVGLRGRRGLVSLLAWDSALSLGHSADWSAAAVNFAAAGLLAPATVTSIRRRQSFGDLIGNTDMHFGNLSFWGRDTLPLSLTPSYDMLPMFWAPAVQGEIPERDLRPLPPTPAQTPDWLVAAGWAEIFWQRLSSDDRVSSEFVAIAQRAGETVRALRSRVR